MTATATSDHPPLHVYMRDHARGKFLSTRAAGHEVAADLERVAAQPGDLIVDFDGIDAATPPYLQEVVSAIASIVTANPETGRIVLLANLNEDLSETWRFVTGRTKRAIAYSHGRQVDLLEDRPSLAETLTAAQKLKPFFTAPELARKLKIKDDTATQRLKKLVANGAAERRDDPGARRGIRHLYRVAKPDVLRESEAARKASAKRTQRDPVAA